MNTSSPSPFSFSPHRDLLEASIPTDEAGQVRFVEECKNRGRGAVQAQSWPDAVALYRKALECCEILDNSSSSSNQKAILHSNLSLAAGKMNQWAELALPHAQHAVDCDASYTKGWWRLGQAHAALEQYTQALQALNKAAELEPNNKALQKELEKLKKLQSSTASSAGPTSSSSTKTTTPAPSRSAMTANSSTAVNNNKKPSNNDDTVVEMEVEGTEFTKSDHVKGYKIVNGKKTSYFHTELSEEAKQLIGDIQPTKLDPTTSIPAVGTAEKGTSAWNKAGTWEEKDCTAWAIDSLQKRLQETTYNTNEVAIGVEKATVTGSASVATVRGKRRFIYELAVKIEWKLESSADEVTGRLEFPDVDGTCPVGEPYEASGFVLDQKTTELRPLCEKLVYKGGMREALHQSIDAWVGLFQKTYG